MKRRVLAAILVAILAFSLAACGGGGSSSGGGSGDSGSGDSGSGGGSTAEGDVEIPEEITIMIDGTVFTQLNARDEFIAELERLTGIETINVIQPDHSAYYDVVGQTFASGSWPDAIILSSTYYAGYAAEGVLWDMTDAWDNSELKASGRIEDEALVDGLKMNGELYGFAPNRGNGCVTYVKQDWLDRVGLEPPTTYEEFFAMGEAFTSGDQFAITAPGLIGGEAPFINFLPEFYQDAYPSFHKLADGTWSDGFTEESMKGALQRLQDGYEAGIIDREALTSNTADCRTKFYDDRAGVFSYWAGTWATNLKTNLENNGLSGDLVALEPIEEVGTYIERVPPVWAITETAANPEGIWKYFIEPILDGGEIQFLWTYGVEDIHWSRKAETILGVDYEEGQFHMRESLEVPGTLYTKGYLDPTTSIAPIDQIEDPMLEITGEESLRSSEVFNSHSRMADLIVSTSEMNQYNGDLQSLKNEIIALVATQGMTVEDGMAKFDSEGGNNWSKMIVDSLNALND